jgi:sugar phosphate isomerase/epimerase
MRLGIMVPLNETVDSEFKKAADMGFSTCQLLCWNEAFMTDEYSEKVKNAEKKYGVEITAFWCGWQMPAVWDFYSGPITLGIVPKAFRFARTQMLLRGSDFAKKIGVKDLVTHVGFIPENPNDPDYNEVLCSIKYIAEHCRKNDQHFLFETGQETPVTLLRVIQDLGMDNIGVNLDPANLLLYGRGNPVDSISVYGKYIRGVHAKDGEYPTDGRHLGEEKPIGEGRVNFPLLIAELKKVGYDGALTIENEIVGDQENTIIDSKRFLEKLI